MGSSSARYRSPPWGVRDNHPRCCRAEDKSSGDSLRNVDQRRWNTVDAARTRMGARDRSTECDAGCVCHSLYLLRSGHTRGSVRGAERIGRIWEKSGMCWESPGSGREIVGGGHTEKMPGRRTPLGARPLRAANIGARGYCGPARNHSNKVRTPRSRVRGEREPRRRRLTGGRGGRSVEGLGAPEFRAAGEIGGEVRQARRARGENRGAFRLGGLGIIRDARAAGR